MVWRNDCRHEAFRSEVRSSMAENVRAVGARSGQRISAGTRLRRERTGRRGGRTSRTHLGEGNVQVLARAICRRAPPTTGSRVRVWAICRSLSRSEGANLFPRGALEAYKAAVSARGFLLVSLWKTPRLVLHVFVRVVVGRGVSDRG